MRVINILKNAVFVLYFVFVLYMYENKDLLDTLTCYIHLLCRDSMSAKILLHKIIKYMLKLASESENM